MRLAGWLAIRISFITEDVGNRPPMLTEGRKRTQHAEVLSGVKPFRWTPKRKSGVESCIDSHDSEPSHIAAFFKLYEIT